MDRTSAPPLEQELEPGDRQRLAEGLRVAALARPFVPAAGLGCLGFARLRSSTGTERDLLLGTTSHIAPELALIDWRSAPLAEIFFNCEEGEEYAVDLDGRTVEGVLLSRALLSFDSGELVRMSCKGRVLARGTDGAWQARLIDKLGPALRPRPPALRGRTSTVLDAELDLVQRAAVELPPRRPLLLLGEAGCGKTTVALHRVARLERLRGKLTCAVVVPTEGLRLLTEALLERLGVRGAQVFRFDRFAAEQARRAFPDLPRRESEGATGATMRLKRHPAVRSALRELARLPITLPPEGTRARRSRAHARREDLHALFGDSKLVNLILATAGDELTAASARDALEHTRIQFSEGADKQFAHVDLEARATSDGRAIDDGTPMEDAGTIDAEDYPVMFELDRLRAQERGQKPTAPRNYDCVVLDEAQELAPLELALVGRSVAPGGTLIVAGDAEQQVDAGALFGGWAATMRELGAGDHDQVTLAVSYRCPPEVTDFARTLRAEPALFVAAKSTRPLEAARGLPSPSRQLELALPLPARAPIESAAGAPRAAQETRRATETRSRIEPAVLLDGELHVALWLIEALRDLRELDPSASIAVISRSAELATRLARPLGFGLAVRLALGGRFNFAPGVQLTCVDEVKGLEFDHTVVPDCTSATYPDTAASRRALYVAVTRPRHQLLLAGARSLSPLAPRSE